VNVQSVTSRLVEPAVAVASGVAIYTSARLLSTGDELPHDSHCQYQRRVFVRGYGLDIIVSPASTCISSCNKSLGHGSPQRNVCPGPMARIPGSSKTSVRSFVIPSGASFSLSAETVKAHTAPDRKS